MFQTVLALVLFLFPLAYSPGPGNMFFAANGARFGFRATMPANFGYHVATWVVTLAMGLGFISALDRFPQIFEMLKILGSIYVLWIAWKLFNAGSLQGEEAAKPATVMDGIVLLVLNPKAYVIIALMFTQFLDHQNTGHLSKVILIASVFTLNNMMAFAVWTAAGDRIARFFRTPEQARKLNRAFGLILAGVAVWMFLS